MKAFQTFGLPVLRFNFRGTGRSEGVHDDGRGEKDDVRAALDWLDAEFERPILFAGFSFGAAVGLEACCGDSRVHGLVGLGLPVRAEGRNYRYDFLANCTQPKLFISGTNDQYGAQSQHGRSDRARCTHQRRWFGWRAQTTSLSESSTRYRRQFATGWLRALRFAPAAQGPKRVSDDLESSDSKNYTGCRTRFFIARSRHAALRLHLTGICGLKATRLFGPSLPCCRRRELN